MSAASAGPSAGSRDSRRGQRLTLVRVVLALGLLAIAIAGVAILLQREQRRAGTNLTTDAGYAIQLSPGQQLCEPGELLPGDTGALRLDASTKGLPGPPLSASIGSASGPVSSGLLKGGWRTGRVTIPISHVRDTMSGATVCLRNLGAVPLAFGGSVPDSGFFIQVAGKPLGGRVRIEYMRPGRESWLGLLPTLAHRFSLAKADLVRHWAAGAVLVLMLLAVALAARTLIKEEPSR